MDVKLIQNILKNNFLRVIKLTLFYCRNKQSRLYFSWVEGMYMSKRLEQYFYLVLDSTLLTLGIWLFVTPNSN